MRYIILITLSVFFFVSACERIPELHQIKGYAQGTTYGIKLWKKDDKVSQSLKQEIDNELQRIDKLISGYRDDSKIERFNQQKVANTPIKLDKEIIALLNKSADVYKKSSHCFDPTVKPLFQLWGFDKKQLHIPTDVQIAKIKEGVGLSNLVISQSYVSKKNANTIVDLSAIGQGYAIGKISELLEKKGYQDYLVELGGEMLVVGFKPDGSKWQIGIERPVPLSKKVSEVITLTGGKPIAIMTSGTYRHYFDKHNKRYSHILDPHSGRPVEHQTVAATVIIDNATFADAWSTALLCLGVKEGIKAANDNQIPAIFYEINSEGKIKRTLSQAAKKHKGNWVIAK